MLQRGQVVEVVKPMSVGFQVGHHAFVREVNERGDFVLEHSTTLKVPEDKELHKESFGFAYQSCLRVVEEVAGECLGGEPSSPLAEIHPPVYTSVLKALGSGTSGFGEATKDYNPDLLETFENKHREMSYWVQLICGEFTSLCPKTGQADWAELIISYVPDKLCVESKATKLYLASFREHGAFHESVVNIIADDLFKLMSPFYLEVYGRFNPRGGIAIYPYVTRCRSDDQEWLDFTEMRNMQFSPMPQRGPQLR